jgi:hypothetical protein
MMSVTELDYQGARIRLKGDMLNLTDMWRAAKADPSKQPAKWREHEGTRAFIDYMSETLRQEESLLFATKEGRGGGTLAHWQIGMAYAKYLSPAFHAWCNSIVRAHMESRDHGEFEHQVIERLDRIERRVDTLEQRLPHRRREIARMTRLRLADVTLALGGRCPCCGRVDVVNADGDVAEAEFDHFYSNQLPTEEHCWLICVGCHGLLTSGKLSRDDAAIHFRSFQMRRTALVGPECG